MKKVLLFMLFINKSLVLAGRHFFGDFLFAVEKKATRHKGETSEIKFP